jgi:hypothetical protein
MTLNSRVETAPAAGPVAPPVPTYKRWLVYGVLGVVVAGHLWDVATHGEHWPFSCYPMWARANTQWKASEIRLRGVVAGTGAAQEIPLTKEHFRPMPMLQVSTSVREGIGRQRRGSPEMLRRRTSDLLAYYESQRRAGRHGGAPLEAIRVYEYDWDVNVNADNVDRPNVRLVIDTSVPDIVPSAADAAAAVPTTAKARDGQGEVR